MNRITHVSLIGIILVFGLITATKGQQEKGITEGQLPYTPTRLEWLVLELNSRNGVNLESSVYGYGIDFYKLKDKNTILILATQLEQTKQKTDAIVKSQVQNARKLAESIAKGKGWDNWLKIEEAINVLEK